MERNEKKEVVIFRSSCEINETVREPRRLQRSLPAFNRLFNHTWVGSQCGVPPPPSPHLTASCLKQLLHRCPLAEIGFPWILNTEPIRRHRRRIRISLQRELKKKKKRNKKWTSRLLSTFSCFLLKSFTLGLKPPQSSQRVPFGVGRLPGGKQDFTPTVTLSLCLSRHIYIFQLFFSFFFPAADPLKEADIDANTMCLLRSPSGSWTTLLWRGK